MVFVLENILGGWVLTGEHGVTFAKGSVTRSSTIAALNITVFVAVSVLKFGLVFQKSLDYGRSV